MHAKIFKRVVISVKRKGSGSFQILLNVVKTGKILKIPVRIQTKMKIITPSAQSF